MLVDAAIELFGQQGYAATGVAAIATRAGVTPSAVIHHFGSKENLLRAVLDEFDVRAAARVAEHLVGVGPACEAGTGIDGAATPNSSHVGDGAVPAEPESTSVATPAQSDGGARSTPAKPGGGVATPDRPDGGGRFAGGKAGLVAALLADADYTMAHAGLATLHVVLQAEHLSATGSEVRERFLARNRALRRAFAEVVGEVGAAELVAFLEGALTLWLLDPATVDLRALYESYLSRL
ncbi:helix-turn-helix domain-containing protein [Actinosynnema sp. NPDC050436]|uniref:TetR/AcrR family transcriptional regulator n=1 Tax=Actinosynnema sp. NPDC050436 TaxID=3155659 RepID=UPI0033C8F80B